MRAAPPLLQGQSPQKLAPASSNHQGFLPLALGDALALGPGVLYSESNTSEPHGADPLRKAKQAV